MVLDWLTETTFSFPLFRVWSHRSTARSLNPSKNTDRTEKVRVSSRRGSPNLPDHQRSNPLTLKYTNPPEVSGPLPGVTKKWMALWPVDHPALVDTSTSPRTAPTSRLECDVTMFFHGSSTKTSTDPTQQSYINELGTLTGPRSLLRTGYPGPHPVPILLVLQLV